MSKFAWVTLTTNDTYSLGALVLAHSLRRVGTVHQLAVLITPGVSESMRNKLKDVYNVVQEVNVLDSQDAANLALLQRPELGITFTKLHCWRLVQFEKCVFLDSDTLVLQNSDELFEREELSAAPDVSWPDCFNSGVFVYRPSLDTFAQITEFALKNGSFDGGDQGLLNAYFADWATTDITKHLPFIYNVTAYASYCYLPAFKQFKDKIKILHFAGKLKPWLINFDSESKVVTTPSDYSHAADLIQLWWNIFCDNVHQKLSDNMNYQWPPFEFWNFYEKNYQNSHQYQHNHYHYYDQHRQSQYIHHHNLYQEQQQQQQLQQHEYYRPEIRYGQQQQQQTYESQEYNLNPPPYDFNTIVVKEFHDPWLDYYERLEKQIPTGNENNSTITKSPSNLGNEKEDYVYQSPEKIMAKLNEELAVELANDNDIYQQQIDEHNENHNNYHNINQQQIQSNNNVSHTNDLHASNNTPESDVDANATVLKTYENIHSDANSSGTMIENVQSDYQSDDNKQSNNNEVGLAGALSQLRLGEQRSPEQEAYEHLMRRQCWELGHIDYAGKDSFDNIWKKITETLESKPAQQQQQSSPPQQQDKSGSS